MTTNTNEAISLVVNGDDRTVPQGTTVADLLETLGIAPGMVVVERNREILKKDEHPRVELTEGDRLELVHFVGGG